MIATVAKADLPADGVCVVNEAGQRLPAQVTSVSDTEAEVVFSPGAAAGMSASNYSLVEASANSDSPFTVDERRIEGPHNIVEFADDGSISRLLDKATGREQSMQIISASGLSDDDVERMVHEAERYSEQDQHRRTEVEARNQADGAVYGAEKLLREQGDKVPAEMRSETEAKMEALKAALQGADLKAIEQLTEELGQVVQRVGASMYQEAGADASAPPGGESPEAPEDEGNDEDIVEGEFSEA